ncbi:hypothetical protein NMY22_g1106 [Coprinellus aureogranulatus]|nr:hypothetical protein NMY22_g1106 [Coprinellus aureogranulatus]
MSMHPSSFLQDREDKDKLPSPVTPVIRTSFSNGSSVDGKRQARQRETQFILKYGRRHHSYDSEKAPYPMCYDKDIVELEALDNRLTQHLRGSSSFVNFEQPPTRVLDLGCGSGSWVIEAAKEWPDCEFVGFDLVNVQFSTKLLEPSVGRRIHWKHGNFLTTKLPFDDDEFDHVHIRSIARGVPENKWGPLFEEISRVLAPGGSIEIIEDDVVFPTLPKWFTGAMRPKARPSTAPGGFTNGSTRQLRSFTPSTTSTAIAIPLHDHALLESLNKSVFEQRFINSTPTSVLPSYFTTYFRHVTICPVITFPMPLLAPPLPLPPQIVTSFIIEPNTDSIQEKRFSTISRGGNTLTTGSSNGTLATRGISHSFSSTSTASTTSTGRTSSSSLFSGRPRTASASLASPWSRSSTSIASAGKASIFEPTPPVFRPFMLDTSENDDDSNPFPTELFSLDQLRQMSERSLAMHLYRAVQTILACQEAMWEELKDRIRNRREELIPFGWDDDELSELKSRLRFERLIERFKAEMHVRLSLWSSLEGIGWKLPTRDPLSKAELIEEDRIREGLLQAAKWVTLDDVQTPCRSIRVLKKQVPMPNKGKGKENVPNASWEEHNTWAQDSQEREWSWRYLNDFSSSKVPPLFSKDGSYFFCLAGVSIKIFSVASGQVVSELLLPATENPTTQNATFTAAVINPHNVFQLITSTGDGRLLIWDFLNAALLRQIDIGQPIHFLCVHEKFRDSVVAAASLGNKKSINDNDAVVLRISLKATAAGKSSEVRAIGKTRSPSGLAFSQNGSWIVASAGHTVYVAKSSALDAGFVKYVSPERLTCLAMHPSEDYFATGDEKGNIRIWYCLNSKVAGSKGVEQRSQTTSLHWHAHAVSALAFTPNGAYLLSGGEEAVLVIWQVHSGKKETQQRGIPTRPERWNLLLCQLEYLSDNTVIFTDQNWCASRYPAHGKEC